MNVYFGYEKILRKAIIGHQWSILKHFNSSFNQIIIKKERLTRKQFSSAEAIIDTRSIQINLHSFSLHLSAFMLH